MTDAGTAHRGVSGKTVLVGVGAGIAAYKVGQLVRDFRRAGIRVWVMPTPTSTQFVGTATWESLSENPVAVDVFDSRVSHIEVARQIDAVVLAPATADLLARLANGLADDLLTTTVLACRVPLILAPAMHTAMWENPATQANVGKLRERGGILVGPVAGELASRDVGVGRMADVQTIFDEVIRALSAAGSETDGELLADASAGLPAGGVDRAPGNPAGKSVGKLAGKRVVVSAGGTREPIDPVRFLGNNSSGRQGLAVAQAALAMGAQVTLVAANVEVPVPPTPGLTVIQAPTAADVEQAVLQLAPSADVLVMAAAVADFRPTQTSPTKIEKESLSEAAPTLTLERTPDILATVAHGDSRPPIVVGFAAQTGSGDAVRTAGKAKAIRKGADLLAVNAVGEGRGFGDVENELFIFDSAGTQVAQVAGSKAEVAASLLDLVAENLKSLS